MTIETNQYPNPIFLLSQANTFTAVQIFPQNGIIIKGAGTGTVTLTNGNSSTSSTATFAPGVTGNVMTTGQSASMSTPTDPTGTTSTTPVMMGLAKAITPNTSTRILVTISGQIANNTAADGATYQIRFGTGTAPINGAALTGTQIGANPTETGAAIGGTQTAFSITALATGLTLGTAIWIDLAIAAVTGGTASVNSLTIVTSEA